MNYTLQVTQKSGAYRACQGQPGMFTVVLGQMGQLGSGTWWCHTSCQGQLAMSWMPRVVAGTKPSRLHPQTRPVYSHESHTTVLLHKCFQLILPMTYCTPIWWLKYSIRNSSHYESALLKKAMLLSLQCIFC